jgi:hypothetical protein
VQNPYIFFNYFNFDLEVYFSKKKFELKRKKKKSHENNNKKSSIQKLLSYYNRCF